MASGVEICNAALSLLGRKEITSLEDTTPEARACRLHWPILRDRILRDHPWNCAVERISLNRLSETPAYEYEYYYQLPANTLFVHEINPEAPFLVEGRKLLCSETSVDAKVTFSQTDASKYDAQLTQAFTYLLAGILAYPMTSSSSLADQYTRQGEKILSDAKASDALEGRIKNKRNRGWLNAKLGGR